MADNQTHPSITPTAVRSRRLNLLCLVALLAGFLGGVIAPGATRAAPATSTPDLAQCEELEPQALRDELNRISQGIFAEGETGIDVAAIVAREWVALDVDRTLDRAVADAVEQVRTRSDLWERFLSGWSPAQAEALTTEVAAVAFASETFSRAIDELAEAVAGAVALEVTTLSAESAAQTTICLQTYIGGNYSQAFVAAFTEEIRAGASAADLAIDDYLDAGLLTVLGQHRAALGGVGVIIAGQIARRVVQRIGQDLSRRVAGRVAGRILGRVGATVVPAVGWIVGIGLIVYDVVESRDGALPQIQAGLQAAEVKAAIRTEIVAAVEPELRLAAPQVAREVANELYATWLDFQRKYRQVLALADENIQFRALLSGLTDAQDANHLASLVDVLLTTTGRTGFDAALAGGELQRLLDLPPAAVEILRSTRSVEMPLAWATLAGSQLEQVVALEIYKHKTPQELDRDTLLALISLNDAALVNKLILLEPGALAPLLNLSGTTLRAVAAELSAAELGWLSRYIANLPPAQANQLVLQVIQQPQLMASLLNEGLVTWLASSNDIPRALAFLATPAAFTHYPVDVWAALSGQIPWRLFSFKYGWWVTIGTVGGGLLFVLALAFSLLKWLLAPITAFVRIVRAPFRRPPRADAPQ